MTYLFWDFNGTILDDAKLCFDILNEMLIEEERPTVSYEDYLRIFDFPVEAYYAKVYDLNKTSFTELAHRFINKYQPRSLEIQLHEDVVETILYFKKQGVKHILLSASEVKNLNEQLKHYKINHLFDEVLGTSDVYAKSKVAVGKKFIENKKINPKDCVMVGDTLHDAEVAEALGMRIVLFSKGHQHPERLKHYPLIHHLSELKEVL